MIGALLERLAPHWPVEDEVEDGPDTRSFRTRLHAADQYRSENPKQWLTTWSKEGDPYWEVAGCLQWTHWGIGVDVESELPAPWYEGHLWVTFGLGPYTVTIARSRPKTPNG